MTLARKTGDLNRFHQSSFDRIDYGVDDKAMMERQNKSDFLTTFHQLCARLLTSSERHTLHRCLQAYQTSGQLNMFLSETLPIWTSPRKLQLLPFVRQVIAPQDRARFDAMLGIHEGFVVRGPRSDKSSSSVSSTKSGNHPLGGGGGLHVVKISGGASPRMGFSVRGGSELGLGIYVSQVEPDSHAERGGLRCGDQILESNGVDVVTSSIQRAVALLSSTHTQTLVVRRTKKVPEWKVTKERILWYDVATHKLVAAPTDGGPGGRGSAPQTFTERRAVLRLARGKHFVGLNIRGGRDFGVGIYVSRVDTGGLAERAGVKLGDQLIEINEQPLDNTDHFTAVKLLRTSKRLVLTLLATGRFPVYRELYTEYMWSDSSDSTRPKESTHAAELHPEPRHAPGRKVGRLTQRTKTRESRIDRSPRDSGIDLNGVDLNNPDPDYDDDDHIDGDYDNVYPGHTELFYPRDKDIIFRGNYSENWRRLDKAYGTQDDASVSSHREVDSVVLGQTSLSCIDTDSDSSDADMDYTAFLERKVRRDEERRASLLTESYENTSIKEPVLLTGGGLIARPRRTESSSAQEVRVEPILVTGRAEHESVKRAQRIEETPNRENGVEAAFSTYPIIVTTTEKKRTEENTIEPILIQTRHQDDSEGTRVKHRVEHTDSMSSEQLRNIVKDKNYQDDQIYAVVHKPDKQQTQPAYDNVTLPGVVVSGHHRSADTSSISSNNSVHSEDSDSTVTGGHDHHHRTHIYHINNSPPVTAKHSGAVGGAANSDSALRNQEEDEDYVVMTEVMDEVAIRPPSPPADYRRASVASSTSSNTVVSDRAGSSPVSSTTVHLLNAEIRRLEARKSNIGSREIFSLGQPEKSSNKRETEQQAKVDEEKKVGKWSAIKKKLTGSLRIKKDRKQGSISMGSIRRKGVFERSFGSQMMNQQTEDKYNLMMVEERARKLLSKDESDAVLRHIKTYHDKKDLDRLVNVLMAILDRPDKVLLLKDVRGVVLPSDVGRFDSLVAQHQATAFDTTSSKLHLPLSALHRTKSAAKPRSKLMTTVIDADGHFHIECLEQPDQGRQEVTGQTTGHMAREGSSATIHVHPPSTMANGIRHGNKGTSHTPVPSLPRMWSDDIEVVIVENEPPPPPPAQPPPEEGFVVYLSKQKKNLGLIVCGGAGDHMDSNVRIEMIMPWGAAADDEWIESGMHILSVDDQSVKGMTQAEAIALLKRCFNDTTSVNMKLRLKRP